MAYPDGLSADDQEAYAAGIAAFNAGDFYGAHDHFEYLWGEPIWKGLVQAAVALHHYQAGNPKGIEGLPENVVRILADYVPASHGLDVEGFLAEFQTFFDQVQQGDRPPMEAAPRLKPAPA